MAKAIGFSPVGSRGVVDDAVDAAAVTAAVDAVDADVVAAAAADAAAVVAAVDEIANANDDEDVVECPANKSVVAEINLWRRLRFFRRG